MSRLEIVRPRESSRWQRMVNSMRSYWLSPQSIRDPLIGPTWDGQRTVTGVSVSEHTALNYSPVWAAVNLISGDISRVPLFLYKRTADGRGKERFAGHPLYKLIHHSPNPFCDSMQFRRTLQAWALVWGNGFAEIERDGGGRPVNLWPIDPCRVSLFLNPAGELRYRVYNQSGDDIYLPSDMLHIRGMGSRNEYEGDHLIARARESIALGIAAERFGGALFGNGATMGGTLTHPGRLSAEARENLRSSLNARHQGVDRAHKFLILEENMTFEKLGIPPNDAQFLETRQFQLNEVARWFNLPPHKIGDLLRSTNNNIEQQSIDYTTQTLEPWFETWKHELEHKLISPSERGQQVIDHEKKSLLSGDQAGRSAFYAALYNLGAITANEIRAAENMNPLPGGDTAFVQLNMTPADKAGEFVDAQIKQMTAKPTAPAAPSSGDRDALIGELADKLAASEARAVALVGDVARAERERTEKADALAVAETIAKEAARVADEIGRSLVDTNVTLRTVESDRDAALTLATETQARADAAAVELKREVDARADAERKAAEHLEESKLQSRYFDKVSAVLKDAQAELDTVKVLAADERSRADQEAIARQQEADSRAIAELIAKQAGDDAALIAETNIKTSASLQAAQRELADAMTRAQDAEASAVQLRDQVTLAESVLFTANADHATAVATMRDALSALERERDDAKAAAALLEARAVAAETEHRNVKQSERDRMAATIAAHRALIVDALGRMVRRETEKARRHQASPEKLRSWIKTFGIVHEPVCVEALLPAVRTHLAWTRSTDDPTVVTTALVREHIAAFVATFLAVADNDAQDFPAFLEAALRRWETDRPEVVADEILRKEIDHVRTV